MDNRVSVLLIEDDPDCSLLVSLRLNEACGPDATYAMECAETLKDGLAALARREFDAVLLDLMLPDCHGLEGLAAVKGAAPGVPVVVLTGLSDEELSLEAIAQGAQDYLVKQRMDARALKKAVDYALERSRLGRQLETLIAAAPEGMLVLDAAGRVLFANQAALQFLERPREEILGSILELPLNQREVHWKTTEGERVGELRAAPIEWRKQKARLAFIHDITELRKVEQLKAEIRERRRIEQLKDQFMSTVSHELRSPLTVIKAAVANLWDGLAGPLSQEQAPLVEIAVRNVDRLARIINNVLDLSRLESGRANAESRPVNMSKLAQEAVQGARLAAGRLLVELEIPAEPPVALADPDMIAQVLQNLLDNALRFARGKVRLAVSADGTNALACVSDDGPGIPPDRLPDLFNKFVQINRPSGGSGYKGTGLGLAICQEILRLNHGRIWAEGAPGQGARFVVAVPLCGPAGPVKKGRDHEIGRQKSHTDH